MAPKRKKTSTPAPPPPPRSPSFSSEGDGSSSEEEQALATPTPSLPNNPKPKRTDQPNNKSDSESESESESCSGSGFDSDPDPKPPKATPKAPFKPSNSDSSSDESEDEAEGTEEPKPTVEKSESKPDKKKAKVFAPDQSLSVKSSSAFFSRIWSDEDEMAILKALSEYNAKKGQLPQPKDYAGFLSTVSSSIGFPVTEKQIGNKIYHFKRAYEKKIKNGFDANLSKSHDKAVFEMCAKLFEATSSKAAPSKKKFTLVETNGVLKLQSGGAVNARATAQAGNSRASDSGVANGAAISRSYHYLRGFIEELIKEEQCFVGLTIEDLIALIAESAKKFEAKIKTLRVEMLKLLASKQALKAELLNIFVDELADD